MKEELENDIRVKSNNCCVICHNKQTECYLLDRNKEENTENLILLCDICANKYLGNPDLIKQLKQTRDFWYRQIEEANVCQKNIEKLNIQEGERKDYLNKKTIAIYHVVYANEFLEEATKDLYELLWSTQEKTPNYNRILYLDIDGHTNENGEFDEEMKELQQVFLMENLLPFFHEIYMPVADLKNPNIQRNDIPKEFCFFSKEQEIVDFFRKELQSGAYILENIKKEYNKEKNKFIYRRK